MKRAVILLLLGCHGRDDGDTGPTLDTGWFHDTAPDDTGVCPDRVSSTAPAEGATDWYWRDDLVLHTTTGLEDAFFARVLGPDGVEVPTARTWAGNDLVLTLEAPLSPSADHAHEVTDCAGTRAVPFATSAYGEPLATGPHGLVGRTYAIDLRAATWVKPAALGAILSLYFDSPILTGVRWADARLIDLLGARGQYRTDGTIRQDTAEATWDYPATGFEQQPYFAAAASEITIDLGGAEARVYDYALSATFSADGSRFGGGRISGLGDTRELGALLNLGEDPNAVCELAVSMGAACEACPDGQLYCLYLEAEDVEGTLVPDLVLVQVVAE